MKFLKILLLINSYSLLISCSSEPSEKNMFSSITDTLAGQNKKGAESTGIKTNQIFKGKVIVILSEKLNKDSTNLHLQDYEQNGKSFIPFFTSIENYNESTKGQIINEKIEIDGIFLLSVLKGDVTLRQNPSLKDDREYNLKSLQEEYSKEIENIKSKMGSNTN